MNWIYLILGGVAGTFARYLISTGVHKVWDARFPFGTLVVNMLGCFLVGFIASVAKEKILLDHNARLLLIVGFCGAFTTFSAFMLETNNLLTEGNFWAALMNVMGSVALGFIVFRLGIFLGELF